ncbi:MAG: hypothetical protein A3H98_09840 [Bacteroidetes bacterium RIFCSPLOWO2_02_FULL_36_8]|nr:MAG: hypothetical protein A3H98_09840 [Bacteroidetes bacterium RIFCSPLOWO2_02_FULL_36_8]OFY71999.1 MAG: hypothetical protein A3G23_00190 [Bacteroidetes bacterium RIFCSPLOWO2_12_FULL_37_12]
MKKAIIPVFWFTTMLVYQTLSQTILLKEDFTSYDGTSSTTPAGWTITTHSAYTSSSYAGPSGVNSYKFSVTNAQITSPSFSSMADTVKFWMKLVSGNPASKLVIESYISLISQWDTLKEIDSLPTTGTLFKFKLDSTTTQLKLTYIKSTGNLAFDDFSITTSKSGDFVAPVITLLGSNPMTVNKDSVFTDPGATAQDDKDGDITNKISITGSVNTLLPGTYLLHYNVSDLAGNPATEVIRTVNVIELDLTPPTIVSAILADNNDLDVFFSESMDATTSQNIINYSVSVIGNPVTAIIDPGNDSLVHLNFTSSFTPDLEYTLTISGVKDKNGNTIQVSSTIKFTYSLPAPKDIIISEIMFDPDPQVSLPNSEFIEIYNRSQKKINVSGWEFTDGTTTGTLSSFVLEPGNYLILCPATAVSSFTSFGSAMGLTLFPSLNNSGDNIVLSDNKGTEIDKVSYYPSWMGNSSKEEGGWTLEIKNPDNPCSSSDNWTASTSSTGGTPGIQNSVYSTTGDLTPPELIKVLVLSSTKIKLVFSETLEKNSLANVVYSPSTGIIKDSLSVNELNAIYLTFGNSFTPKVTNSISVSGVKDCWGNAITTPVSKSYIYYEFFPASAGSVVINEIYADPDELSPLPYSEYVELYNTTQNAINLKDFKFSDATSSVTIPEGAYIEPEGFLILCPTSNVSLFPPEINVVGISISLNNTGERLTLANDSGKIISTISYTVDWYVDGSKDEGGWSLEQIDPYNPCSREANWSASTDEQHGTPGRENSLFANNPDLTTPQLERVGVPGNDSLIFYFDESVDSSSLITLNYIFSDTSYKIISKSLEQPDNSKIIIGLNKNLVLKKLYYVSITGIKDCSGNTMTSQTRKFFAMGEKSDSMDIIINEVLFDPLTGGYDFVELFNRSEKFIDLKGWQLANTNSDGEISTKTTFTFDSYILFPKSYCVITLGKNVLQKFYKQAVDSTIIGLASMPSYSSSSGSVVVLNEKDSVSDWFNYSYKMHFALLDKKKGVSLERVSAFRPTNEAANWHSAATTAKYATPGFANSQGEETPVSGEEFYIIPGVFTPDNDGKNDFTTIGFNFNTPNAMGILTIYDVTGRKIKSIANNELLGKSGTWPWDGTTDDNTKARVGYYIVYFEVYNLEGKTKSFKKTVVVGARF